MSEEAAPDPPPTLSPIVFPPVAPPRDAKRSGCLSWGLIGCAGASVVAIVGLVFLMSNARSLMGWALGKLEDAVMMGCTADVTPVERTEFRVAFGRFADAAKEDRVTPEQVQEVRQKVTDAVKDGRVTPEEIRDLTDLLRKVVP
jgi:hypothetical protein